MDGHVGKTGRPEINSVFLVLTRFKNKLKSRHSLKIMNRAEDSHLPVSSARHLLNRSLKTGRLAGCSTGGQQCRLAGPQQGRWWPQGGIHRGTHLAAPGVRDRGLLCIEGAFPASLLHLALSGVFCAGTRHRDGLPGIPGLPLFLQCTPHRLAKVAHRGHLSPPVTGRGGGRRPWGRPRRHFAVQGRRAGSASARDSAPSCWHRQACLRARERRASSLPKERPRLVSQGPLQRGCLLDRTRGQVGPGPGCWTERQQPCGHGAGGTATEQQGLMAKGRPAWSELRPAEARWYCV